MTQEGIPTEVSARTAGLLDRAAALCARRGARLTELRREVLGLILESTAPVGAYELLDRLRAQRGGGAPPTVYRALDFLLEQGFVHRLERLSAFVGCIDVDGSAHGHVQHEPAQFLICRGCGRVTEIEDSDLARALLAAAARVGFAVAGATVEAEGMCAECRRPESTRIGKT
jgi:Fur family transcriptional regulator, zinc uptake regulator